MSLFLALVCCWPQPLHAVLGAGRGIPLKSIAVFPALAHRRLSDPCLWGMIKSCRWDPVPVNYAGEGHLTRAGADSGAEGPAWQASVLLRRAVLQPRLPSVSSSLYCPKDNIEEALLLLLISESMVSSRPLARAVKLWGLGTAHRVLAALSPQGCP